MGPVDIALLFGAAAARTPLLGDAYLTIRSDQAAGEAATILGAHAVVPLHTEGWAHFTQGADELRAAFAAAGTRRSPRWCRSRGESVSL